MKTIIVALIIISGLVGFARLQLQAHNPAQVYTGFIVGFTGMIALLYIGA
jgi:membrane-associated phospholipid phosphatase